MQPSAIRKPLIVHRALMHHHSTCRLWQVLATARRLWLWLCAVLLLLACAGLPAVQPQPWDSHGTSGLPWPLKPLRPGEACEDSDMCSVGKVKPFIGDVNPSSGLRAALEARAYKREIIFIAINNNRHFITLAAQLISNLEYLGFGHVLLLANHADTCKVFQALFNNIGCAWDSSPWIPHSMDPTWFLRAKMNARVPRLGYNTLMMDADSIMFQDPYRAFRAPGLRDMSFLCMSEAPHGMRACYCNGGFARVQGARPDGAITWMFKEFVERAYRNMDDGYEMQRSHGMHGNEAVGLYALSFDQSALQDALLSTLARQPIYPWLMVSWALAPDASKEEAAERMQYYEHSVSAGRCHKLAAWSSGHPLPPELTATLGPQSLDFEYWPLHVPDSGRSRNATALGPALVPKIPSGEYSSHFARQLRDDCPGCPWWPDVNGARTAQHDASKELFAVPPEWLIGNGWHRAQPGYWAAPPGYHAPQVVGHIHVLHALTQDDHTKAVKRAVQSHLGYSPQPIDWGLSARISAALQEAQPNVASVVQNLGGYATLHPRPRLVLYNPRLSLAALRTPRDYQLVAFGLAQLAALSGRMLSWPALDCTSTVLPVRHYRAWSLYGSHYYPPALNASFAASSGMGSVSSRGTTRGGQRNVVAPPETHTANSVGGGGAVGDVDVGRGQGPQVPGLSFPFFSQLTQQMQCYPMACFCNGCIQGPTHTDTACPVPALLPNEVPHWLDTQGMASLEASEKVVWLRGKRAAASPEDMTSSTATAAATADNLVSGGVPSAADMIANLASLLGQGIGKAGGGSSMSAPEVNTGSAPAQAPPRGFESQIALVTESDARAFLDAHADAPVIVLDAFMYVDLTEPTSDSSSSNNPGSSDGASNGPGDAAQTCMRAYAATSLFWKDWDDASKQSSISLTTQMVANVTPAMIQMSGDGPVLIPRGM